MSLIQRQTKNVKCGSSSVVEHHLAKVRVASSSLVFRSRRRHSQVVRQRSAKPLFPSSNLGVASIFRKTAGLQSFFFLSSFHTAKIKKMFRAPVSQHSKHPSCPSHPFCNFCLRSHAAYEILSAVFSAILSATRKSSLSLRLPAAH